MKILAFYLPQFHSIPENDKWWGEGFTEWVNVKKSSPQFKGHVQPEVPLNDNYYCLLDEKSQIWQSELAKKYGIDGFCYYHYWFSGKLLLEKPMENMLKNKAVDMPFCICWANEAWSRNWDGHNKDVLIAQNYEEDEEAWKAHFEYLLKFFKDERYIKHEGKPMLLIYKPNLIENCAKMAEYWQRLAKENGFPGLYIGWQYATNYGHSPKEKGLDFNVEFEPFYTLFEQNKKREGAWGKLTYAIKNPVWLINRIKVKLGKNNNILNDYDTAWRDMLKRHPACEETYAGAFPAWDNTPRRGRDSMIFTGASPEKFKSYLLKRIDAAKKYYKGDFLFINAWNEWAEGAHLEPDSVNKYGYLEAVKRAREYAEETEETKETN